MQPLLSLITYPKINPDIISWPFPIRWYGVAYLTGFIIAYFVLIRLGRRGVMRMPTLWVSDMVGWLALGVVIGGRTGWWLFYHVPPAPIHETFFQAVQRHLLPGTGEKWWEPIAIWHGGMSFHGGLMGVLVGLYFWCRSKKLSFLNLADSLALVAPIGLCLGRIANFINGELYGRPSNVPWAMIFPSDPQHLARHPSQLYESFLEGPVLLGIVWLVKQIKNRRDGEIAASFVVFYALVRFCVEFTREPDAQLGFLRIGGTDWITMGQVLSIAIGIVGLVWWVYLRRKSSIARIEIVEVPPQTQRAD